jgi:hypothetical protein
MGEAVVLESQSACEASKVLALPFGTPFDLEALERVQQEEQKDSH